MRKKACEKLRWQGNTTPGKIEQKYIRKTDYRRLNNLDVIEES